MVLGWIERNMLSNNNPMNMEVVHDTCNVMVMRLDLKSTEKILATYNCAQNST